MFVQTKKRSFKHVIILVLIAFMISTSSCTRTFRVQKTEGDKDQENVKSENVQESIGVENKSTKITQMSDQVFFHTEPAIIYVSPDGDSNGLTRDSPVKLDHALLSSNIISGDTLVLLDGIYKGVFQIDIKGNPGRPLTIRPLNDYKALIDGGLTVGDLKGQKGSHVVVRNLHITNTDTWRGTWETVQGSISRVPSINIQAPHVSVINNLIHDGGIGVCGYSAARECLVYGNVIWNSGWADDVQGGAQNIYMHSDKKTIRHNVFAGAFKRTVQLHGNRGALTESTVSENVAICKQSFLIGSYNVPNYDIVIDGNHILGWAEIGYVFDPNDNVTVSRNIIYSRSYSGIRLQHWKTIRLYSNKIIKPSKLSVDIFMPSDDYKMVKNFSIDSNMYYQAPDGYKKPFEIRKHRTYSFPEWQELGYDVNGSLAYNFPETNEVYVYPNEFPCDKRMGIVVIWNWAELDNVAVNLNNLGLIEGEKYLWRNAQDPLGDTLTWSYDGEPYLFPMTGRTVAYPIGFDELLVTNQFPLFGCFIIEKF